MSSETIASIESRLSNEIKYLSNIKSEIDKSLKSVSDIYWLGKPSDSSVENYLYSEKMH